LLTSRSLGLEQRDVSLLSADEFALIFADYALWWFTIQILLAGTTIMIGLAAFRSTTVDQAIQSRKFIPSPHRYKPAEVQALAQDVANAFNRTLIGLGDIGP
jgi:hypothetical protein